MTVNSDTWKKIAERYNSKAKWADALLMLNLDEHEDLLSALIELDPSDLLGPEEEKDVLSRLDALEKDPKPIVVNHLDYSPMSIGPEEVVRAVNWGMDKRD